MVSTRHSRPAGGFTLVELLVVIGIIALLVGILLPVLGQARHQAKSTVNISNIRQIGTGLEMYRGDWSGKFPKHSSLGSTVPRTSWADYLLPYIQSEEVFTSPLLNDIALTTEQKKWAHTLDPITGDETPETRYWGGYGLNYQYLGNSREPDGVASFHASTSDIRESARTVAFTDTKGSRKGDDTFDWDTATYSVDPPLQSMNLGSRGSRRSSSDPTASGNYGYSGGDGASGNLVAEHRATPDARNAGGKDGRVAVLFVDGHGVFMEPDELDDSDGDGNPDNGLWNGLGDPSQR